MVNTVRKKVFEADKAYLAGLFDGDGSIMAMIEKHQEKKFGFRIRVIFKITQKERQPLAELKNKFCVGCVVCNRKAYDWIIRDQSEIKIILKQISSYLMVKSKQVDLALKIIDASRNTKEAFLNTAKLADSLARLNVRSKNRRKNYLPMVEEAFSRND